MSRLAPRAGIAPLALGLLLFGMAHVSSPAAGAIEMTFTKGDTRDGTKVRLRILGDSIHYHRTLYAPDAPPQSTDQTIPLDIQRERTLKVLMGEIPRYPIFGSCYGKGMRYYLVDTGTSKFYRSVPANAGKCYLDEPGIFNLFEDLDDLLSPPTDSPEDLSAS